MTVLRLFQVLAGCGVTLFLAGDRLKFRSPTSGVYTEELRSLVDQHRAELIEVLGAWDQAKADAALAEALARCDLAQLRDAHTDGQRRAVDAYRSAVRSLLERHDPHLFTVLPDLERAFARWHTLENSKR
jgi:hypothetical protein